MAILDIGSGSVGGALLTVGPKRAGHISAHPVFYANTKIRADGHPDFARFSREIAGAIRQTIEKLLASGLSAPVEYHCFLASPFIVSQTKLTTFYDDRARPFTAKSFSGIARRNAEDFLAGGQSDNEDFYLLENKVMRLKLDGYEVVGPKKQKAKTIEVAQYLSGSPASVIKRLARAISAITHNDRIIFHSYSLAAWGALRDYAHNDNFLAVDVSGELTDVLVSIGGALVENISFPYGMNKIRRDLAGETGSWPEEAEAHLALFLAGKLHPSAQPALARGLAKVRERWLAGLREALAGALSGAMLPETLILTGETDLNPLFLDWIKTGDLELMTLADGQFHSHYLNHFRLSAALGSRRDLPDTYILLETYYLEKMLNLNN